MMRCCSCVPFRRAARWCELTESLLAGIAQQVAALRDSGADMDLFDSEQFSGIAGTVISDSFTYEVARWLVQRYPNELSVDWDFDEQGRQMGVSLPRVLPAAGRRLAGGSRHALSGLDGNCRRRSGTNPALVAAARR